MIQEIDQSYKEKYKMYKKVKKKKLIKMLIECNRIISSMPIVTYTISESQCNHFIPEGGTTAPKCMTCGKPEYLHNQYK